MPGVRSYIDDIVIYSDSWEDHLRMLKELFGRLRKARITARPTKCLLEASRMEFLGHQVGGDIITPSRDYLEKGTKYSAPDNQETSEKFLYSLLKEYLLQEPVLKLPHLSKPFVLRTDASGVGVVAVLLQENYGKLYPEGFMGY